MVGRGRVVYQEARLWLLKVASLRHNLLVLPTSDEVEEEVVIAGTADDNDDHDHYVDIDAEYDQEKRYSCTQRGCRYKAKQRGDLNQHLAYVQDIGVVWFKCTQEGCGYKAKERGTLKRHLTNVHDIGVEWHKCTQEGCDYKAKHRFSIWKHMSRHHA